MKRTLHGLLATVAVFLLLVPAARAQVDRATLSGVVKDTGGGVVPGATVLVTNLATSKRSRRRRRQGRTRSSTSFPAATASTWS